jgi:uncharacterized protein (TIGR02145 family)
MKNWLIIISLILSVKLTLAQEVHYVTASQEGQRVKVAYDLECESSVDVKLFFSEDNGKTWKILNQGLSGDVGNGITQGSHFIYWDVLQSEERIVGNEFVFKVVVGAEFETIQIGDQIWMAENLNVDHYRNGDLILEVKGASEWRSLTNGAWCYYNSASEGDASYGKLYNWYTVVDDRGLCPPGWHVPSDKDWKILEKFLGDHNQPGGHLKSSLGWKYPNTEGRNIAGFSAMPGGYRFGNGIYYDLGSYGYWWTNSSFGSNNAWTRKLEYNTSDIIRSYQMKEMGFNVRCIKD